MNKYWVGNKIKIELTEEEKGKEKAKKSKGNSTNKEVMETLHLILEALGIQIEGE